MRRADADSSLRSGGGRIGITTQRLQDDFQRRPFRRRPDYRQERAYHGRVTPLDPAGRAVAPLADRAAPFS